VLIAWRLSGAELRALLFVDFYERAASIMRDRRREAEAAMRYAAFTAWLQGAGGNKIWGDFCRHYGLIEAETTSDWGKKDAKELFDWAEEIAGRAGRL